MSDQLSGKKGSSYPVIDEEFSEADRVAFLKSTRIHAVGMKAGSEEFTDGNLTLNDLKSDQIQADWAEVDDTKPSYIQNKPTIPSLDGYATEEYVEAAVSGKQDKIGDLEEIRSSAELGAAAVQGSELEDILEDYAQLSDITVSGVTVDGQDVVNEEGVAEIPAIPQIQGSSTIDYITGSGGKLTVKVPVPAPKEDHSDQGKVLTVNDTDKVVWSQPSSSIEISPYNGDVSTISTVNAASSGGYVFNLNIDTETLEEQHDEGNKKYVTVKNPLPSAEDASNGDVLTVTDGQVGWLPAQGGGGGGGNPYTKSTVTANAPYDNGEKDYYDREQHDQDITISNNTYSVCSNSIGYGVPVWEGWNDPQGLTIFNLHIKLPANTEFPMAVVEFIVYRKGNDDIGGCVNNIKVEVGNTQLTRIYSTPYNENPLLADDGDTLYSDNDIYHETSSGQNYYKLAGIREKNRTNKTGIIYGTKVQVNIFGNCFSVSVSQYNGDPSAS